MLQDRFSIRLVAPSDVGTGNRLRYSKANLNISDENVANTTPVIVQKQDSSGNGKVMDDIIVWNGDNLEIQEGATGFAAGDVFTVDLVVALQSVTATAATV